MILIKNGLTLRCGPFSLHCNFYGSFRCWKSWLSFGDKELHFRKHSQIVVILIPILGKSLCLFVKEVLYYRGVFRDCQKLGTFGTEKAFSCWEASSSMGRNLTEPTLTVMLGVHVRKFWEGGEHKGGQNIENILCCFRTRQLQGRVTLMILSKLINTLLMLLKLSRGWRKKSQLSPVMTMAKTRTVHRYEMHLHVWCLGSFYL